MSKLEKESTRQIKVPREGANNMETKPCSGMKRPSSAAMNIHAQVL